MSNLEWHFRQRDPGEAIIGGVNQFALQMSIDTLVRETIQNSNDQRLDAKVVVEFVYEELVGPQADKLLELIGWDQGLREHLQSIADGSSHLKERAARAVSAAKARKIHTLTIRDLNARGLEGDEDGESGNFAMLCRHSLVTDGQQKRLRGGSFGIGKSVLWAFSGASTVLFSSLPMEKKENKIQKLGTARFFGRAYLVSHVHSKQKIWHNGDGHFGEIDAGERTRWAKSIRDAHAKNKVAGTVLDRDWKSPGTSILIPFFDNPRLDEDLSPQQVVDQITKATQEWFWPCIDSGILEVHVGIRTNNSESLTKVDFPAWASFHKRAIEEGKTADKIEVEGGSAKAPLAIKIPKRLADPTNIAVEGHTQLYVTRLFEDEEKQIPERIRGSVALIRGAQMVVEYHKATIPALLPPFVGVLKAGHFNDSSDDAVEYFLRDSEPPAHDKWDKAAEKIGLNYQRGGHINIVNFLNSIGAMTRTLLGSGNATSGRLPKRLADLLSGGKGGKIIAPREERFKFTRDKLSRDASGLVTADFTARRNRGTGRWSFVASVVLRDEQSTAREISHKKIDESALKKLGVTVVPELGKDGKTIVGYRFGVPDDINEVKVQIVGDGGVGVGLRALADLQVRYQPEGGGQ
jgi:hypothetical protein